MQTNFQSVNVRTQLMCAHNFERPKRTRGESTLKAKLNEKKEEVAAAAAAKMK